MVQEVFGLSDENPMTAEITIVVDEFKSYFINRNDAGGRGCFLPQPDIVMIEAALKQVDPVRDVEIQAAHLWPVKMGSGLRAGAGVSPQGQGGTGHLLFCQLLGQAC
jgi:hypothetical protein